MVVVNRCSLRFLSSSCSERGTEDEEEVDVSVVGRLEVASVVLASLNFSLEDDSA